MLLWPRCCKAAYAASQAERVSPAVPVAAAAALPGPASYAPPARSQTQKQTPKKVVFWESFVTKQSRNKRKIDEIQQNLVVLIIGEKIINVS